jgi:hypothetical protein
MGVRLGEFNVDRLEDHLHAMDLKTLKMELLERIANLEDEARLLALKHLLDLPAGQAGGPPTYTLPSEHLTVVREGEAPYLKLEDRMYTAEEVRALVEEVLADTMPGGTDLGSEEVAALDASRERFLKGEGTWLTRQEMEDRMKVREGN